MNLLITGATGFVGKVAVQHLADAGHSIVVLSRNAQRARQVLPSFITVFEWDGLDGLFPHDALKGIEGVVHLAGEPVADFRWSKRQKRKMRDSRVIGTRRLVEAVLREKSIRHFISSSAIGYYGDGAEADLREESSPGVGFGPDICVEWEQEAARLESSGVRVVRLRIGIVLGNAGGLFQKLRPIFSHGLGSPLGNGRQWMSWIHVKDMARLIAYVLETDILGAVNAVAPQSVRNREFSMELAKVFQKGLLLPIPKWLIRILLGERGEFLMLYSQKVSSRKIENAGFKFIFMDLHSALKDICNASA